MFTGHVERRTDDMVSGSMPIKDLLRGLRSGMTAGRMAFEPVYRNLPPPARDVIKGLDMASARLDTATSRLAHTLFDETTGNRPGTGWTLALIAAHPKGETIFARLAYGALAVAFQRFSDSPVLISETLACQAFARALRHTADDREALPAELVLQLLSCSVIRPMPFEPHPTTQTAAAERAIVAFVLMLCAAHDASVEDNDLLDLCCDVAPLVLRECRPASSDRPALRNALAACAHLI